MKNLFTQMKKRGLSINEWKKISGGQPLIELKGNKICLRRREWNQVEHWKNCEKSEKNNFIFQTKINFYLFRRGIYRLSEKVLLHSNFCTKLDNYFIVRFIIFRARFLQKLYRQKAFHFLKIYILLLMFPKSLRRYDSAVK